MASDRDRLIDILIVCRRVAQFIEGCDYAGSLLDERTRWAVHSQFVVLGEAARNISDDYRASHPDVPWSEMIGMRNRMAHGYNAIDWLIVWDAATERVPELAWTVEELVGPTDD